MKWMRTLGNFRLWRSSPLGQALFFELLAAVIFGAALSVASVGVEDEDGTVFEGDFDWLSGCEALVEQVETRLRIVV